MKGNGQIHIYIRNKVRMLNIKALKEQWLKKSYLIMHKKSNLL